MRAQLLLLLLLLAMQRPHRPPPSQRPPLLSQPVLAPRLPAPRLPARPSSHITPPHLPQPLQPPQPVMQELSHRSRHRPPSNPNSGNTCEPSTSSSLMPRVLLGSLHRLVHHALLPHLLEVRAPAPRLRLRPPSGQLRHSPQSPLRPHQPRPWSSRPTPRLPHRRPLHGRRQAMLLRCHGTPSCHCLHLHRATRSLSLHSTCSVPLGWLPRCERTSSSSLPASTSHSTLHAASRHSPPPKRLATRTTLSRPAPYSSASGGTTAATAAPGGNTPAAGAWTTAGATAAAAGTATATAAAAEAAVIMATGMPGRETPGRPGGTAA